jgi:hypothetical protein
MVAVQAFGSVVSGHGAVSAGSGRAETVGVDRLAAGTGICQLRTVTAGSGGGTST